MARLKDQNKSPTVWFPHYHRDFLQKIETMTASEVGALILLMGSYWVSECKLPIESDRLRRITRMTRADWNKSAGTVLGQFELTESGYRHPFLDREYAKACELTLRNSEKGKLSAEIRRNSKLNGQPIENVQNEGNRGTTPVATEWATEDQPKRNPSPSPSPIHSLDEDSSISINKAVPEKTIASDRPKAGEATSGRRGLHEAEFEQFWRKYPLRKDKGRALKAFIAARGKVSLETLMAGLKNYSWPEDAKYIKYPATWLNAACWADEPPPKMISENDRRIAELEAKITRRAAIFDGQTIEGECEQA